jgi:hypothetical protein
VAVAVAVAGALKSPSLGNDGSNPELADLLRAKAKAKALASNLASGNSSGTSKLTL